MVRDDDLEVLATEIDRRAAGLPYRVTFEIDEPEGLVILRGMKTIGLRINGATTGWPLNVASLAPPSELDRAFGFLQACLGSEGT